MLDNLKHFASLKAMGAGNLAITRMVGLQTAWVGGIGYGIGVGGGSHLRVPLFQDRIGV